MGIIACAQLGEPPADCTHALSDAPPTLLLDADWERSLRVLADETCSPTTLYRCRLDGEALLVLGRVGSFPQNTVYRLSDRTVVATETLSDVSTDGVCDRRWYGDEAVRTCIEQANATPLPDLDHPWWDCIDRPCSDCVVELTPSP